jgi:hypothetical protein
VLIGVSAGMDLYREMLKMTVALVAKCLQEGSKARQKTVQCKTARHACKQPHAQNANQGITSFSKTALTSVSSAITKIVPSAKIT